MVAVELRDKLKQRQVLKTLEVREVRGRVWKRSEKEWVDVRLWTNLREEKASATEVIAALLMACTLLAQERLAIAAEIGGEVEEAGAVRISLRICLDYTQALWTVLSHAEGLMDAATQQELARRMREQIAAFALPPRRPRSCDRKVRQPIKKWARMMSPTSTTSHTQYEVTTIA